MNLRELTAFICLEGLAIEAAEEVTNYLFDFIGELADGKKTASDSEEVAEKMMHMMEQYFEKAINIYEESRQCQLKS